MNEKKDFLKEGIYRYKQAYDIYWKFREEIEKSLTIILSERKEWGDFIPDKDTLFSRAWANGLILNARLSGKYDDKIFSIGIGIDWSNKKNDLPVYFLWLENEKRKYIKLNENYNWAEKIEYKEFSGNKHLIFHSNQKAFNLERDFNLLLDEFTNSMKGYQMNE